MTLRYLSPEWFDAVASLLPPATVGRGPEWRVGYEAGELCHTQWFHGDRLVGWTPGLADVVALVVSRDVETDAAALLGRGHPDQVAAATAIEIDGETVDLWGLHGVADCELGPAAGDLEIDMALAAIDSPFGRVDQCLEFRNGTFRVNPNLTRPPHISLTAPYATVLRWLHDPQLLLGHLMVDGCAVTGDIFRLSAAEGLISHPSNTHHNPTAAARLAAFAEALNSSPTRDALDAIEELTADTHQPGDAGLTTAGPARSTTDRKLGTP